MGKNKSILLCILGSFILSLTNNPMFQYAKLGLFPGGYAGYILGEVLVYASRIIALVGYITLFLFAILLIVNNIKIMRDLNNEKD